MAYTQNNPFSRKTSSPLKHNVTDPRGGVWEHGHQGQDPNANRGWKNYVDKTGHVTGTAYSPKILRGSTEFGKKPNRASENLVTGTNRMPEELGGKRNTEYNNAMSMANQLAELYNTGQFTGGNFLAEEFYKNPGKLSLKNNKVSWKGGNKGLNIGKSFNVQQGVLGDDGAYTIPENQFTGDQIYEMMKQSGGLVSIVDGIGFVSGNPGQNTVEMPLDENELRGRVQYNAYDPENKNTYDKENIRVHKSNATYDPTTYVPRGYNLAEEGDERFAALGPSRKSSSPFYKRGLKSSPLNQNHDDDTRSGNEFVLNPDFNYGPEVVTTTEGEWVIDPNNPEQMMQTNIQDVSITGTRNQPEVITSEGDPNPPINPNPEGLSQEELNQNWTNFCLENPTDPRCQGFNKREGIEIDDTDIQNIQRETINYRPIEPPEIIKSEPELDPYVNPLDLTGGRTKRGNWSFKLPDLEGMSLGGLKAAGKRSGKSCSKCNKARWIDVLLGRKSG